MGNPISNPQSRNGHPPSGEVSPRSSQTNEFLKQPVEYQGFRSIPGPGRRLLELRACLVLLAIIYGSTAAGGVWDSPIGSAANPEPSLKGPHFFIVSHVGCRGPRARGAAS